MSHFGQWPRESQRLEKNAGEAQLCYLLPEVPARQIEALSQHRQPRPRRQNAPNELVKHLYNFSSFYKEGLLYTIYTWR